jgi:hypothetical protein
MLLRFVDGRPVSAVTCAFLAWAAEHLAAEGVRVLALIWDDASWHISREVRDRVGRHNRAVKSGLASADVVEIRCPRGCRARWSSDRR